MAIEIKGYNELLAKFNKLADLKGVESGMQKSCALVERAAKQKAPKDTGELKRSISSRVINEGQAIIGEIFTQLEYAPYIEYGTGLLQNRAAAQKFLGIIKTIKASGTQLAANRPNRICGLP